MEKVIQIFKYYLEYALAYIKYWLSWFWNWWGAGYALKVYFFQPYKYKGVNKKLLLETVGIRTGIIFLVVLFLAYLYGKQKEKIKSKALKHRFYWNVDGVVFGKKGLLGKWYFSPSKDKGHIGVFAGTGTGKTYTIARPTLEHWYGTSFVIDVSGDLASNVKMDNMLIYEPEIKGSAVYSPFSVIDNLSSNEEKNEALQALALLLLPNNLKDGSGTTKYFQEGAQKILQASLIAFYFQGLDFCDICKKIKELDYKSLFEKIDSTDNALAKMLIGGFVGENSNNISGCKGNCDRAIDLFATNSSVYNSVHRPKKNEEEIKPNDLEDCNIFVCVSDNRVKLFAPLLSIITAQMMDYISGRLITKKSEKILLLLDEFKTLGLDAEMINNALAKYRKKLCRVMILTQSIADLRVLYGDAQTEALLTNIDFKVLLGGLNDPKSSQYFADLIGYKKVQKTTEGTSHNDYGQYTVNRNVSEAREYVIEPAQFDSQGLQTCFVIHNTIKPYKVAKLRKVHRVRTR